MPKVLQHRPSWSFINIPLPQPFLLLLIFSCLDSFTSPRLPFQSFAAPLDTLNGRLTIPVLSNFVNFLFIPDSDPLCHRAIFPHLPTDAVLKFQSPSRHYSLFSRVD